MLPILSKKLLMVMLGCVLMFTKSVLLIFHPETRPCVMLVVELFSLFNIHDTCDYFQYFRIEYLQLMSCW